MGGHVPLRVLEAAGIAAGGCGGPPKAPLGEAGGLGSLNWVVLYIALVRQVPSGDGVE